MQLSDQSYLHLDCKAAQGEECVVCNIDSKSEECDQSNLKECDILCETLGCPQCNETVENSSCDGVEESARPIVNNKKPHAHCVHIKNTFVHVTCKDERECVICRLPRSKSVRQS